MAFENTASNVYTIVGYEGDAITDSRSPAIPDKSITIDSTVRVVFILNAE
jgi:hypothetical protein